MEAMAPTPWVLAALLLAAPVSERIVWQRDDLMPPAQQAETLRLRVLATAKDGATTVTRGVQTTDIWKRRLETQVLDVAGEELTGAAALDLNDDGIKEVLLRFSPPRDQRLVHLVALCFSRRDQRYVKVLDQGPAAGLSARWVSLVHTRDLHENGIAVDVTPPGQDHPTSTTIYRLSGEMLHVASHAGPGPAPAPRPQ